MAPLYDAELSPTGPNHKDAPATRENITELEYRIIDRYNKAIMLMRMPETITPDKFAGIGYIAVEVKNIKDHEVRMVPVIATHCDQDDINDLPTIVRLHVFTERSANTILKIHVLGREDVKSAYVGGYHNSGIFTATSMFQRIFLNNSETKDLDSVLKERPTVESTKMVEWFEKYFTIIKSLMTPTREGFRSMLLNFPFGRSIDEICKSIIKQSTNIYYLLHDTNGFSQTPNGALANVLHGALDPGQVITIPAIYLSPARNSIRSAVEPENKYNKEYFAILQKMAKLIGCEDEN